MPSTKKQSPRFHTFSENTPEAMMIVEGSGRLIAMNASARKLLGYSKDEVVDLDLASLGADAIRSRFSEFRKRERVRAEGSLLRKDGEVITAVFNTAAMGDGSYQFVLVHVEDRVVPGEILFESAPLPLIELDLSLPSPTVKRLNMQARVLCGQTGGADNIGTSLTTLLGLTDHDAVDLSEWAYKREAGVYVRTWMIKVHDHPGRYGKAQVTLVGRIDDPASRALLSLCDITDEVLAQNELRASVKEKTVFLKESQHRIKNNLELLGSMLSLQRGELSDQFCARKLLDAQTRIKTIALLHDHLSKTQGDSWNLQFGTFIEDIIRGIRSTCLIENAPITIATSLAEFEIDSRRAGIIGLIVNEIITNAVKHAFATRSSGMVWVKTEKAAGDLRLTIADDGDGLPLGFDWRKQGGLGFKFIDVLSQQLSATAEVENDHGFKFSLGLTI
jgi:PAS domain S-box-containing protein